MFDELGASRTEKAMQNSEISTLRQTSGAEEKVMSSPELTSMIFAYLKESSNSTVPMVSDQVPTLKVGKWRAFFANLARVNRAFFHASIDILWEVMDTLEPFFELILPCDTLLDRATPAVPLAYWNAISSDEWKRFEVYSSRTKTLILNRKTSPEIDPSWLFYIASSTKRPAQLFPAIKHLVLTSNDTLSLFIAFHVTPQIDRLTVHLDKESKEPDDESSVAFTSSLAENAGKLTSLRLVQPVSWKIIDVVATIPGLKRLSLRVEKHTTSADLSPLNELKSLEALAIEESTFSDAFPSSVGTADAIARESSMDNLTELRVTANCTRQFQVARHLSPKSLRTLKLNVLGDLTGSMAVLPLFILVHAQRNTQLTSLVVTCRKFNITPGSVEDLRGDPRYTIMEPFINALSSLHNLTILSITGASFFSVDIIVQMLRMLRKLPQLQVFRFLPLQMTALEADDLMIPTLGALKQVSRHNPNLRELAIPLDIYVLDDLDLPHGYVSRHGLKKLAIDACIGEETAITTEDSLHMVRYLDRLFPSLETLTEEWRKDTLDWRIWNAIERTLSFCQEIRAQAVNDARLMAS
ncbi:hypothetical protein EST38_g14090 [Candolleomyces aberdarensis]|uniref:F-box domain-containing protein n=1 Tax=Candolleomyces aberdarensis TaxID=2316362 RepID=A0A4Q2D0W7_9AGAR|nr:hypothetical protein EST38_g14090 [Candolleomyces aberdarensis]